MENKNQPSGPIDALNNQLLNSDMLRDYYATEILKTLLANQGRQPQMSLKDRIKFWLGKNGWKRTFNYNFEDCAQKSFELADVMLTVRQRQSTLNNNAIKEIENLMERWHLCRDNDSETLQDINDVLVNIGLLDFFNKE